jgi:hypothetical protein
LTVGRLELSDASFGPDAIALQTSRGPAWVVNSSADIPGELRRPAFADHSKDFRYYQLLEHTLTTQFEYRYLVLYDANSGEWAV